MEQEIKENIIIIALPIIKLVMVLLVVLGTSNTRKKLLAAENVNEAYSLRKSIHELYIGLTLIIIAFDIFSVTRSEIVVVYLILPLNIWVLYIGFCEFKKLNFVKRLHRSDIIPDKEKLLFYQFNFS